MTTITDSQVVVDLRAALESAKAERDAQIESVHRLYQEKIDSIQRALDVVSNGHRSAMDVAQVPNLSVGSDKLEVLRECLQKHPEGLRQADIPVLTGLNSGTVSVGLRRLALNQEVQSHPKMDGSTVWALCRVPIAQ